MTAFRKILLTGIMHMKISFKQWILRGLVELILTIGFRGVLLVLYGDVVSFHNDFVDC